MADSDMAWARLDPTHVPPEIDTTVPSVARVYDAILGGKDNISQVLLDVPHSVRTEMIQARHGDYSKTANLAVRALSDTYMGVMSEFSDRRS
jgi:S-adenosyl methyltransferase